MKAVADRFVVLRDGRNAGGGVDGRRRRTTPSSALMVGRAPGDLFPRTRAARAATPILEVAGLEPGSASFSLHRGEILGIAGLVGAGRTRLLRALFGLEPVAAARVRVGAVQRRAPTPRRALARRGWACSARTARAKGSRSASSVADNLTLTRLEPLRARRARPAGAAAAASRALDRARWRSSARAGAAGGELSGGNQQKVAIARLLHHDVDVLVLDEPTRGIDVGSKAQIYRLIDELVAVPRRGGRAPKAVLMVSSYLPELLGLCDRIAVMRRGRLGSRRAGGGA